MTKQFEYMQEGCNYRSLDKPRLTVEDLNRRGLLGWELIYKEFVGGHNLYLFKREIKPKVSV